MKERNDALRCAGSGERKDSDSRNRGSRKSGGKHPWPEAESSFYDQLLEKIIESGMTDAEVYRRAGMDRRRFSEIRCRHNAVPKRRTVFALILALHLSYDEAVELMQWAGIAFSPASQTDQIVKYCICHKIYDVILVNQMLDDIGEKIL